MPPAGSVRERQRGWAAVITLLFALLIVAVMAGVLLKQQGPSQAAASRAAPAPGADAEDTGNALARARALEQTVQQQAADLDKRIDASSK